MFKSLFNEGYSKKFMDRIEFRRKEYYENRRIQTIRNNAAKMAMNWTHEYPTGTPLGYIRDDIIESWERSAGVGIYAGLDKKQNIPVTASQMEAVQTMVDQVKGIEPMAKKYPQPVRGTRKDPALNLARSQKKYVHNWRNPPIGAGEYDLSEDEKAAYKLEGKKKPTANYRAGKIKG